MVRQLVLFTVLIAFMLASCIDTIAPDPPDDDPRTDPDVGLSASYFDSISAERVLTRIDPSPSFFWPRTGPEPVGRTPPDLFSVVWEGSLIVPESGSYTFSAFGDDGVRVFIDAENVLPSESWSTWASGQSIDDRVFTSDPIGFESGASYPIRIEFYQYDWNAQIQLNWTRPDGLSEEIPSSAFRPAERFVGSMPSDVVRAYEDDTPMPNPQEPQEPDDGSSVQPDPDDEGPANPSFDGIYGARPVPASRDVTIATNRRASDVFVTPNPGLGADCSYEAPCSLSTGLGRNGHVWLFPGTYSPGGQLSLGSDRTLESIDPDDKAIIDFRDRSLGISVSGDDNVLRNIVVRRSTKDGILITGSRNLFHGVTSEHNYGSGFYVYRNWEMRVSDTSRASFNIFQDCIANYNNDNCKGTGAQTCNDGDADGIGFSAGVGNVIDHCEASYNSDDGFDFWMSYRSTITNSIAYRNGYDDAAGYEAGLRRGNGNGFKMGPGPIQAPDGSRDTDHVVVSNWASENALRTFDRNGGEGQAFSDNVCHADQEPCDWWK